MITLQSIAAVQAAENAHSAELDSGVLMERAATGLAGNVIDLLHQARGLVYGASVVLLIGSGNNGGDALFAGVRLARRGVRVDALCATDAPHAAGAAALLAAGGRLHTWPHGQELLEVADVIVDGVVGIGATGALREPGASMVLAANAVDCVRVAVDLPSGIDADLGTVDGVAFDADLTVTFAAAKPGLLISPAKSHVGQLAVIDIGIDDAFALPVAQALQGIDVAELVPEPSTDDYKYVRGVVGIAAGCARYPGASLLCTGAALNGDVGMVTYLDRADGLAHSIVQAYPDVVVSPTTDAPRVTAWGCGSGFEGSAVDAAAVDAVLRTSQPVVLDAGALTALADDAALRALITTRAAPTVVTPHEGEFTRLGGGLAEGRLRGALALAAALDAVVLLKGPGTIIAAPDGSTFIDVAGTSALATAGSGDLLTGVIAALLAGAHARGELAAPHEVARVAAAGAWIHGMAGRLAGADGVPVTAERISAHLGEAVAAARRQPGE